MWSWRLKSLYNKFYDITVHVEIFHHPRTLYSSERARFLVLNPARVLFSYSFIKGQHATADTTSLLPTFWALESCVYCPSCEWERRMIIWRCEGVNAQATQQSPAHFSCSAITAVAFSHRLLVYILTSVSQTFAHLLVAYLPIRQRATWLVCPASPCLPTSPES